MEDRVSTYPGRVRMTPVSGQANVYDLERADQPTEPGTPLNKANLLSDAVAEFLDLENTAVPNDAFRKLGERQKIELVFESIDTSGNWVVPSNIYGGKIFAVAVGGGGGGAGFQSNGWLGGAGGSGHLIFGTLPVTPGQSIPVVIGAGGASTTSYTSNPEDGGNTSFMGYVAAGGSGGRPYRSNASHLANGGDGGAGGSAGAIYGSNSPSGGNGSFGGGGSGQKKGGNGGTYGGGGAVEASGTPGSGGTYGGNGGIVNKNSGAGTNNGLGTDYNGSMKMWNLAADYYNTERPFQHMVRAASSKGVLSPSAGGGGLGSSGGSAGYHPGGGGGFLCNGGSSNDTSYTGGGGLFCSLPSKGTTSTDRTEYTATIGYRGGGGFFALGDSGLRGAGGNRPGSGNPVNGGNGVVGVWYFITPTNYLGENI